MKSEEKWKILKFRQDETKVTIWKWSLRDKSSEIDDVLFTGRHIVMWKTPMCRFKKQKKKREGNYIHWLWVALWASV